jgi:hypothetical protein
MTEPKKSAGTSPQKLEESASDKIPAAVRKLMIATPKKEWPKIRALLVESEEEVELVELLAEMHRVMKVCPGKLVGRVRKHEITGDQLDQAYTQINDAINGVEQALYALLHLAGCKDFRLPEDSRRAADPETPKPAREAFDRLLKEEEPPAQPVRSPALVSGRASA